MKNPYSSPQASHGQSNHKRLRYLSMYVMCISAGVVAATLVYVGDAFRWPHFNRRAGYIGTEFIGDYLYAINDPYAIHIVAFLWFFYAAGSAGILLYATPKLFQKR